MNADAAASSRGPAVSASASASRSVFTGAGAGVGAGAGAGAGVGAGAGAGVGVGGGAYAGPAPTHISRKHIKDLFRALVLEETYAPEEEDPEEWHDYVPLTDEQRTKLRAGRAAPPSNHVSKLFTPRR